MREQGGNPSEIVQRNMDWLHDADWAIFEVDVPRLPSFGTPVEIWTKATVCGQPGRVLVVGDLGAGIFAQLLQSWGVRVVPSMDKAVAVIVEAMESSSGTPTPG